MFEEYEEFKTEFLDSMNDAIIDTFDVGYKDDLKFALRFEPFLDKDATDEIIKVDRRFDEATEWYFIDEKDLRIDEYLSVIEDRILDTFSQPGIADRILHEYSEDVREMFIESFESYLCDELELPVVISRDAS